MKKFKQIIESSTPPQGDSMWLDDAKLKYLKNGEWTSINDEKADVTELKKEVKDLTNNKADKTTVTTELSKKVDKETGKGLSTNDFTTAYKTKLDGIEAGANKTVVDSVVSETSTNPVQNKVITAVTNGIWSTMNTAGIGTINKDANLVLATPNGSSGKATARKLVAADLPDLSKTYQVLDNNGYQIEPKITVLTLGTSVVSGHKYIKVSIPPTDTVSKSSPNWYYATDGTLQDLYSKINVLDLLSYGVSWKPNVADPALTRVGNMTYHKTLPIQNNMKGCIAQPKNSKKKIIYYLNEKDWRFRQDNSGYVINSQEVTVTDGKVNIINDVFGTLQYTDQYIKLGTVICHIDSIDTTNKTATATSESTITAGTYVMELGSVRNGYDGEVMVEIPEFWIKSWDTDTQREVRIAPTKIDDTWEHQPRLLLSPYHDTVLNTVPENMGYLSTLTTNSAISVVNTNKYCRGGNKDNSFDTYLTTDKCRTLLGKPRTALGRSTMRTYSRNANKEIMSYKQYKNVLYWLYVIEYANFNSQLTFNAALTSEGYRQGGLGMGVTTLNWDYWTYYNNNNPLTPCGYTDEFGNGTNIKAMAMVLPTTSGGDPVSSTTQYVPRWHGIENPFGDIWNNVDGIIIDNASITINGQLYNEVYATDNPALYSDSDYKSMTKVGLEIAGIGSGIKEFDLGDTAEIIPRLDSVSFSQYKCDGHWTNTSKGLRTLLLGGRANYGAAAGLGVFYSYGGVGAGAANIGFRSSCELN